MICNLIFSILIVTFAGCASANTLEKEMVMTHLNASTPLDMTGKTITPFILFHAAKHLQSLEHGEVLIIRTDIFKAIESDINAWCRMSGHLLEKIETTKESQLYYVKKGLPKSTQKSLAIIISTTSLEELLSPLGLALSAAISGRKVHLYFQGPGTRLLKKGYTASLDSFSMPFTGFAKSGLAKAGHLPAEKKIQQLKELGAIFYICGGSMDHFGVKEADLIFDDIIQAEYFTILEVMESSDVHIMLQ
ncbi:MAG: DsrE family protein [Deltaproteobacteria bacterium]|nr:DsrE family protein [Candidatus Desulfobacula maris]